MQLLNLIESDYVYIFARKEENPNAYKYLNIHSISNDFFPENMINDRNTYRQFLFEKYNMQQPYMQPFQQPVFTNSFGGFGNVNPFTSNPFMSQPQYQGYPQQHFPQQSTTQFTNQQQYQQPSNGMQNQQPDINVQQTAMPTGGNSNMVNNNSRKEFIETYLKDADILWRERNPGKNPTYLNLVETIYELSREQNQNREQKVTDVNYVKEIIAEAKQEKSRRGNN